eukprot:6194368-Pleurochrysis_carterae.AAC.1
MPVELIRTTILPSIHGLQSLESARYATVTAWRAPMSFTWQRCSQKRSKVLPRLGADCSRFARATSPFAPCNVSVKLAVFAEMCGSASAYSHTLAIPDMLEQSLRYSCCYARVDERRSKPSASKNALALPFWLCRIRLRKGLTPAV